MDEFYILYASGSGNVDGDFVDGVSCRRAISLTIYYI